MTVKLITCQYCGGTGEGYRPGLQGDGWTGAACDMCDGWTQLAVVDGKTYPLGPHAATYRDDKGRFRSLGLENSYQEKSMHIEGNNGGDFLEIEPLGDNMVRLEIGNCCVRTIVARVPVEFITATLTQAVLKHNGLRPAIMALDWPEDFKTRLAEMVVELDSFNRPIETEAA